MLDPGIKVEKGYEIYESGSEANIWVQAQNGKPYIGKCYYIDMENQQCKVFM